RFESIELEKLPAGETVESGVFRETSSGVLGFVVFASSSQRTLDTVFSTVAYLAGMPTGRGGSVNSESISVELKYGVPKGKGGAASRVGPLPPRMPRDSQRISITLGNVLSSSGQSLRTTDFYDGLLQVASCTYQYRKRGEIRVSYEELAVGWLNNRG